jgi:hypothetical protein
MTGVSQILQELAANAAATQLARGNRYADLIQGISNVPAQILNDQERQQQIDLQRAGEAQRLAIANRADARAQADQAQQVEHDRIVRAGLISAMGPDGDPSKFDARAAFQTVSALGRPDAMKDVIQQHQAMRTAPLFKKADEQGVDPYTYAPIPGLEAQPKMPEMGTPAYGVATQIQALEGTGPPAPASTVPAPGPSILPPPPLALPVAPANAPPASSTPPGGPGAPATTVAPPLAPPAPTDYGYGNRYGTSTPKGLGFLGPLRRPDNGKTMSEYSIGVMIDGKETEVPSIVPTLTKDELAGILTAPEGTPPPASVQQKAADYARQRIAAGLDPFAGPGEQQNLYPELARTAIPTPRSPTAPAPSSAPPPTAAGAPGAPPPVRLTHAQAVAKAYADAEAAKAPPNEFQAFKTAYPATVRTGATWDTLTPEEQTKGLTAFSQRGRDPDAAAGITALRNVTTELARQRLAAGTVNPDQAPSKAEIAMANYMVPTPSPRSFATPAGKAMMDRILTVNPDFDASLYSVRAPTRKAYTTGPQGQQLTAMNTAIEHLDQLQAAADALQNGTFKPGNAAYNYLADVFGSGAPTSFATIKEKVDKELDAVASKGVPTVSGAAAQKQIGGVSSSPESIKNYIDTSIRLLGSSQNALRAPYQRVMGANAPFDPLTPEAKAVLVKRGFDPDNPTATTAAPIRQPIPGVPGALAESTDGGKTWKRVQ